MYSALKENISKKKGNGKRKERKKRNG